MTISKQLLAVVITMAVGYYNGGGYDYDNGYYNSDSTQSYAKIVFEEHEHDFGAVSSNQDSLYTYVFTFRNSGVRPLQILHVATGCGCTTPEYSKLPVAPGQKGTVAVTYNPAGQLPGFFRKSITVYTNDPRSYVRIFVKGHVR